MRFSAALSGRQDLLAVVRAIDPQGPLHATALSGVLAEVGLPAISKELRFLESTGLLREKPSAGRCKEFEIVDGDAWAALVALAAAAAEERVVVP